MSVAVGLVTVQSYQGCCRRLVCDRPLFWSRAIDDKYSRREEYRGFTQDFKEKDGYKPDVKIEYVDETGRKLTPKEVSEP